MLDFVLTLARALSEVPRMWQQGDDTDAAMQIDVELAHRRYKALTESEQRWFHSSWQSFLLFVEQQNRLYDAAQMLRAAVIQQVLGELLARATAADELTADNQRLRSELWELAGELSQQDVAALVKRARAALDALHSPGNRQGEADEEATSPPDDDKASSAD